jgi:hypothetical protein
MCRRVRAPIHSSGFPFVTAETTAPPEPVATVTKNAVDTRLVTIPIITPGVAPQKAGRRDGAVDKLHALDAPFDQAFDEPRPERLRLAWTDAEPDDLPLAVGVDRHSNYRRDRDDTAALALLEVGRVEPQIRPVALDAA